MQIIKTIKDMQALSRKFRADGSTVGFAPTMGALHKGHLSLVRQSEYENNITIVSIFVNPAQFGPNEDLEKYPRDLEGDLDKLSSLQVGAVFIPETGDMYSENVSIYINGGSIGQILCVASRPGHFSAVAALVTKLFNIVMPDRAYFGKKDFLLCSGNCSIATTKDSRKRERGRCVCVGLKQYLKIGCLHKY